MLRSVVLNCLCLIEVRIIFKKKIKQRKRVRENEKDEPQRGAIRGSDD